MFSPKFLRSALNFSGLNAKNFKNTVITFIDSTRHFKYKFLHYYYLSLQDTMQLSPKGEVNSGGYIPRRVATQCFIYFVTELPYFTLYTMC